MANFCTRCGISLAMGNETDFCSEHGGPSLSPDATVRCRFCSEVILASAKKCKHCGEFLSREIAAAASTYCTKCGKEIQKESQFCIGCGTARPGMQSQSSARNPYAGSTPVTRAATVKTMRGGWIAVKGFLIALLLGAVGNGAVTRASVRAVWMAVALGVGA